MFFFQDSSTGTCSGDFDTSSGISGVPWFSLDLSGDLDLSLDFSRDLDLDLFRPFLCLCFLCFLCL